MDIKIDIKVETGNLIVSVPLECVNNIDHKGEIAVKVGDRLIDLMYWIEDKEHKIDRILTEDEYNKLIKWLFSDNEIWRRNGDKKEAKYGRI